MLYIIQISLHHLNSPQNIMQIHCVEYMVLLGHVEQKIASIPTCLIKHVLIGMWGISASSRSRTLVKHVGLVIRGHIQLFPLIWETSCKLPFLTHFTTKRRTVPGLFGLQRRHLTHLSEFFKPPYQVLD